MLNTIMKDFKIAKVASKSIIILNVLRKIIFFSVIAIFAIQIRRFCISDKNNLNNKMGLNIWNG